MDNRTGLLDAALTLFARHGYDAVGVQTIVKVAGVTKPTLYHYFGSKRGLFETLIDEQGESLLEIVREATIYQGDLTTSIKNVVRAYFDYAVQRPVFYRMILSLWFAPPDSECSSIVHRLLAQQQKMLEAMLLRAAKNHGNLKGRHRQTAVTLKGMIDTCIGLFLQGHIDLQSEQFQERMIHQFMYGIFS